MSGCSDKEESDPRPVKPASTNLSFSERKKLREAQSEISIPAVETPTNTSLGSTQSLEEARTDFRARLQAITGKVVLSDAELLAKAEQGDVKAQAEMGKTAFAEGKMQDGLKWSTKAAEQGDMGSQYGLAVCYAKGYGVDKDATQAVKWFALAAAQGHTDAQASLARRYADGEGVPQDKAEAYKWYDVATKAGRHNGQNAVDKLAATMTPQEIAEGQRRSAMYVAPTGASASPGQPPEYFRLKKP
ncbi:MAG: hypothetical protein JWQ71_1964 [Pedosphaera sp.]|nr:hypothetical protein [Pedosphaera sp.]